MRWVEQSFPVETADRCVMKVLRQRTKTVPECTHCGGNSYGTLIGDSSWVDYRVEVRCYFLVLWTFACGISHVLITKGGSNRENIARWQLG